MYWLEIAVVTDGEAAEAVSEMLQPYAENGTVVIEQLGDEENLDPRAMQPEVTVKIYLSEADDTPEKRRKIEEILYHMSRLYPIPAPTFRKINDQDWANAWKENYKPFRLGERLWIQPSWVEAEGVVSGDIVLTLDPGMAFGTGLHPTTQLCLLALEELVKPGCTVLDVGTGSGILAIAAAKLGAVRLTGMDTDELAVKAAVANADLNETAELMHFFQGRLADVEEREWDLVVVNILAPIIMELFRNDQLLNYVGENGYLILSGILMEQVEEMETVIEAAGGKVLKLESIGDWASFVIQHAA